VRTGYRHGALLFRKQHPINGRGVTVAIVAPGDPPGLRRDFRVFDRAYGYQTPPSLRIHHFGVAKYAARTPVQTAFAVTVVGMVDYVHVMAPEAKLLVVETPASKASLSPRGLKRTFVADNWVLGKERPFAQIILQGTSGIPESTAKAFVHQFHAVYEKARKRHVTVIAKVGASTTGQTRPTYPSADPLVTAIGTVTFPTTPSALFAAATTYGKIGVRHVITYGGPSTFPLPTYQRGIDFTSHGALSPLASKRYTPDISMASSPVLVYLSRLGPKAGWITSWRYSEAPALFAGRLHP
jgi:subtilase family serine protease